MMPSTVRLSHNKRSLSAGVQPGSCGEDGRCSQGSHPGSPLEP